MSTDEMMFAVTTFTGSDDWRKNPPATRHTSPRQSGRNRKPK